MATLDEQQGATAEELVRQVRDLKPDQGALWQLNGAVGSGKTTVLRQVAEQLRFEQWIPLFITAPAGEIDSAPIALLETARQLKSSGLLNGEMSVISDPARRWREKMDVITAAVDRNHGRVVILCDEPTRWYHFHESVLDDSPDYCARSLAEWMVNGARCRRIVTGWIPNDRPAGRTRVPRLDDGRDLLKHRESEWGLLWEYASQLRDSLPEPVPYRSAWEMKLCVALSTLVSADEAAQWSMSDATADVMLEQLFDEAEQRPEYRALCATLARLALARTDLKEPVLEEFTSGLEPPQRGLLEKCLFDWDEGRAALHPLVRHEVLSRAGDPRRAKSSLPWRLSKADRMAVHDRLKSQYRLEEDAPLRDLVESLHHDLLGTAPDLPASDARLQFVEQLDEIGRTLSHLHGEQRRAAEVFRLAVRLAPEHAYSHHYLAFNLDWLAEESNEVEVHYKTAKEIQPTHPWWWSRWISYLATRGRFREASSSWREAYDAMSISEDSPDWIFLSLHRWVARWLLHWAELDFAERVLCSIPRRVAENDATIQTLWDLLRALRQAERGISVFPLTVPSRQWWAPSPHTELPPSWKGLSLRSWLPARVEGVDRENSVAFLVAGKRPAVTDGDPVYFEIELRRDDVVQAARDFAWDDLRERVFLEIGYYGEGEERMRIGLHRDKTWDDPHLLPLVPPPDRWYRRAVEDAWAREVEKD